MLTGTVLRCCIVFAALVLLAATAIANDDLKGRCASNNLRYELLPLGTLGTDGGSASSINDRGQLIGQSRLPDQSTASFVWKCGSGMTRFRGDGEAMMINNRGQIVGSLSGQTFIWDRARGTQILGLGFPASLNDWGDVTFEAEDFFLWTVATGAVGMSELAGANFAEALVNNRRKVGGYVYDPVEGPAPQFGFATWTVRQGLRFVGRLAGIDSDDPVVYINLRAFNERGELLGTQFGSSYSASFIVKRDGATQFLLPVSQGLHVRARDFNNRSQVVGYRSDFGHLAGEPILWDPDNGLRDLNVLTFGHPQAANGPAITAVNAINELGWIAASARAVGSAASNPALLVPVPANDPYYRNLGRLRGPRLCKALRSLQVCGAAAYKTNAASPLSR